MILQKKILINEDLKGLRLDQALARFVESRSQALDFIQKGQVFIYKKSKEGLAINDLIKKISSSEKDNLLKEKKFIQPKPSYLVEKGEMVLLFFEKQISKPEKLEPYDFPVPIVYEDESLLVVDKPAGLVVHPACGHPKDTLVNALVDKLNLDVGFHKTRPGLVHRLDKGVSGLLVLSKTHQAQNFLARQFSARKVSKIYLAVCFGPFRFQKGRIETFIQRHPVDRKKFISHESKGKKSETNFKILKQKENEMALVEYQLLTGRTHQARIHSLEFSRGIIGDTVYASSKAVKQIKDPKLLQCICDLGRIALHAEQLSFVHPETKKQVSFKAPLPKELKALCHFF